MPMPNKQLWPLGANNFEFPKIPMFALTLPSSRNTAISWCRCRPARRCRYVSSQAASSSSSSTDSALKTLSRPLGVLEKPAVVHATRMERLKQVLTDDKAIEEQRKHLVKEAVTKGYFHDLNATRHNGGKTWIAPKVLIRESKSLYFPDVAGKPLSGEAEKNTTHMCLGKISVISMLGTKISEIHSASFTSPTLDRYSTNPLFQHIQINLQMNVLKSLLVSLFMSSLRRSVPPSQHSTYLLASSYVTSPLTFILFTVASPF